MKQLLLLFILIISELGFSQSQFNSEDFTVTGNDLNLNTFEKDSTANALIIYEYGKSYVDKNTFRLTTEVKRKLKIFNREGFDQANTVVYLYKDGNKKESISKITATTFNIENGKVTKTQLEKSQIFEEKYNDHFTITKFTFPNIKEGSVITYSYTIESPFMFKFKEWNFQDDIPKLYSQYETSIPGNYEYNIKLVGFLKFDTNEQVIEKQCLEAGSNAYANCVNSNYIMRDIPAFIEEDYMTTKFNYLARIEYELKTFNGFDGTVDNYTKTWKTVDSELKTDKNIGGQLGKNSAVKKLLSESILSESDPLTKAKSIYGFVQDTYTWNNEYNIFKDVSIKNLMQNKSGKVSEINILLHNLMDENGFEVKPILLSTRNNGFATKVHPVLSDFNYLIVQITIDDKTYLLDATDKYMSFGQLPFRCLNQYGRLLDFKNGSFWIDIAAENTSSIQYRINLNLTADQILAGKTIKKSTDYHALPLKNAYFEDKNEYIKSRKNKFPDLSFPEYDVQTVDKTNSEFIEEFTIEKEVEAVGDKIYLNPFIFKFFTENLFKLQERTYPIDFGYKDAYLYVLKITVDDSFEILELPKDALIKIPNNAGAVMFNNKVSGNTLELYFKLNFNEAIYNPEYYSSIKKFMSSVVDIQKNSLVVLQKK